jgi:hypothetical protein
MVFGDRNGQTEILFIDIYIGHCGEKLSCLCKRAWIG